MDFATLRCDPHQYHACISHRHMWTGTNPMSRPRPLGAVCVGAKNLSMMGDRMILPMAGTSAQRRKDGPAASTLLMYEMTSESVVRWPNYFPKAILVMESRVLFWAVGAKSKALACFMVDLCVDVGLQRGDVPAGVAGGRLGLQRVVVGRGGRGDHGVPRRVHGEAL